MNIYLDENIIIRPCFNTLTRKSLSPYENIKINNGKYEGREKYAVAWGHPLHRIKNGIMETGFFWGSAHIDTIGLYSICSLNTPMAIEMINNFKAPISARDIVFGKKHPPTKYHQKKINVKWEGVVLPLQNSTDRSILFGASQQSYFEFVEGACRFYKKQLFLKTHPYNFGGLDDRLKYAAYRNGCTIGDVNHSVLDHCKFVITYNSTFVIDCLMRNVKVAQFAPGYFWQTEPVTYTSYEYPDDVPEDFDKGHKLCDFLVWRYLIYQKMPVEKWVKLLSHFAHSKELFPLTEEFCYATNI